MCVFFVLAPHDSTIRILCSLPYSAEYEYSFSSQHRANRKRVFPTAPVFSSIFLRMGIEGISRYMQCGVGSNLVWGRIEAPRGRGAEGAEGGGVRII